MMMDDVRAKCGVCDDEDQRGFACTAFHPMCMHLYKLQLSFETLDSFLCIYLPTEKIISFSLQLYLFKTVVTRPKSRVNAQGD